MKILCIIDHLGSGGAQRQMVNLACGLRENGHQVEMFVYYPQYAFFRPIVDRAGIRVHEARKGRGFSLKVLSRLVRLLRSEKYDAIISFLDSPSVYAELARLTRKGTRLVVSERSSRHGDRKGVALLQRRLHGLADFVVTNSHSHADWLRRHRWIQGKVRTIYNGFPVEHSERRTPHVRSQGQIRLLVIGRIGPEKNGVHLIEGLKLFHRRHGFMPRVSWAGNRDTRRAGEAYCRQIDALLDQHAEVKSNWHWLGERSDIPELLAQHDALIHPSLHEGLPNAVCEALLAGRPVLASNVCDHPVLVEEGERGFLFDPHEPQSIADAIERLSALGDDEWERLSMNARRYAREHLSVDRMVGAYESLLTGSGAEHSA